MTQSNTSIIDSFHTAVQSRQGLGSDLQPVENKKKRLKSHELTRKVEQAVAELVRDVSANPDNNNQKHLKERLTTLKTDVETYNKYSGESLDELAQYIDGVFTLIKDPNKCDLRRLKKTDLQENSGYADVLESFDAIVNANKFIGKGFVETDVPKKRMKEAELTGYLEDAVEDLIHDYYGENDFQEPYFLEKETVLAELQKLKTNIEKTEEHSSQDLTRIKNYVTEMIAYVDKPIEPNLKYKLGRVFQIKVDYVEKKAKCIKKNRNREIAVNVVIAVAVVVSLVVVVGVLATPFGAGGIFLLCVLTASVAGIGAGFSSWAIALFSLSRAEENRKSLMNREKIDQLAISRLRVGHSRKKAEKDLDKQLIHLFSRIDGSDFLLEQELKEIDPGRRVCFVFLTNFKRISSIEFEGPYYRYESGFGDSRYRLRYFHPPNLERDFIQERGLTNLEVEFLKKIESEVLDINRKDSKSELVEFMKKYPSDTWMINSLNEILRISRSMPKIKSIINKERLEMIIRTYESSVEAPKSTAENGGELEGSKGGPTLIQIACANKETIDVEIGKVQSSDLIQVYLDQVGDAHDPIDFTRFSKEAVKLFFEILNGKKEIETVKSPLLFEMEHLSIYAGNDRILKLIEKMVEEKQKDHSPAYALFFYHALASGKVAPQSILFKKIPTITEEVVNQGRYQSVVIKNLDPNIMLSIIKSAEVSNAQRELWVQLALGTNIPESSKTVSKENYRRIGDVFAENGDKTSAARYYLIGAALKDPSAQFAYSLCLREGEGVIKNLITADLWLERAVEGGCRDAIIYMGTDMYLHGQYNDAITFLEELAKDNDASAQQLTGSSYSKLGDPQKAKEWFEKAARNGHVKAYNELAWLYEKEKSFEQAAYYYEIGAYQGDVESQYSLGLLYAKGKGVDKDIKEAEKWFKLAAEQGNCDSLVDLGYLAYSGDSGVQDFAVAKEWFEKAKSKGDVQAIYYLGVMHFEGLGVAESFDKGIKLLREAASKGNEQAQKYLTSKGVKWNTSS